MHDYRDYENYYLNQAGGGNLSFFAGPRYQKGSGLGQIFSGLIRGALPLLKSGGKALARSALKTGTQIASDILEGDRVSEAVKRRTGEAVGEFVKRLNTTPKRKVSDSRSFDATPKRSPRRRRRRRGLPSLPPPTKRNKGRSLDIFR